MMNKNKEIKEAGEREERKSLKRKLSEAFSEWAQSSTSHGLPNIFRSGNNYFLKLMWTVCLLASAAYCAFSVYNSVLNYYEYNVITQLSDYTESPIEFPVVTYCNSNPFTTEYGLNYSKSFLASQNITNLLNSTILKSYFNYSDIQEMVNLYISKTIVMRAAKQLNDTEKRKMGYSLDFSLIMCAINNQPCDANSFVWYYDTAYGNCYQFNTDKAPVNTYRTLKTGKINGLMLMLMSGTLPDTYVLGIESGIQLFIHNKSTAPTSVDSVALRPGSLTYVALKKVFTQKQPRPYNDCENDLTVNKYENIFYKKTFEEAANVYKYEQRNCIDLCTQYYLIRVCGCADANYPSIDNAPFCNTLQSIVCLYFNLVTFYSLSEYSKCYDYCPLECATQSFDTKISSSSFPHDSMAGLMTSNVRVQERFRSLNISLSQANMEKFIAGTYVYFDDNKYRLITESPAQSIEDLMSNVGGILGLYIGVSFLSFVELFELFFQMIFISFRHHHQSQSSNRKSVVAPN